MSTTGALLSADRRPDPPEYSAARVATGVDLTGPDSSVEACRAAGAALLAQQQQDGGGQS